MIKAEEKANAMADVCSSLFGTIDAFVFRCKNDPNYTMEFIEGHLERITGYRPAEVVNNTVVSYAGLMIEDDVAAVTELIDTSIERREPWNVLYHITHKNGSIVAVRERGCAVFENGEAIYFQGLVVSAKAEEALRIENEAMLTSARAANVEIVKIAENITGSLRALDMLSVNARIEAARSGDAGKGFAIVADEIKKLADENKYWVQEIGRKINATQKESDEDG